MDRPRILVVDDEPVVLDVVERYLVREGYAVTTCGDGVTALERLRDLHPHLVVLDIMLPGVDGLDICERIRARGKTPVIMVTARGDLQDRITGLQLGADDYIAKPFSPRELVARVNAVMRRSYDGLNAAGQDPISAGGLVIEPRGRVVRRGDATLELTTREFDLLWFLATHPAVAFTREQLLKKVWEFEWISDTSTVTVHVRRLRSKIEANPDEPRHLKTVWGVGYRWDP
jgi:DNA-binding response OmpR family regulator